MTEILIFFYTFFFRDPMKNLKIKSDFGNIMEIDIYLLYPFQNEIAIKMRWGKRFNCIIDQSMFD